MSKIFAIVENNKISNLIVADDQFMASSGMSGIDVTDMNPRPHIGFDVINGVIQFPVVDTFEQRVQNSQLSQADKTEILNKIASGTPFTDVEITSLSQAGLLG